MKVSLNWLKEFLPLSLSPEEIADALTLAGLEVDKIEKTPFSFEGVVFAKVIETQPHPQAEKLCIATVSDQKETFQVVCGAPNCRKGLITAFAKVGSQLTDDKNKVFTIKKCKLRGVESFGMLCGAEELGLPSSVDGIMEFDEGRPIGMELKEVLADTLFDISLTPNLGHCMSYLGIARELSALLNLPLHIREVNPLSAKTPSPISIEIEDEIASPYYRAQAFENIAIGPSPEWLEKRLLASNIRPINNVVDITNYVMLELGQPMHAFDLNALENQSIKIQKNTKKLNMTLLDGIEYEIPKETLLIFSSETPIAVAGVMGGGKSAVNDKTTSILLEAASFHPIEVRASMKKLKLRTESSARFEKGIDSNMSAFALSRASQLLIECALAKPLGGPAEKGIKKQKGKKLNLRLKRLNKLLGISISLNETSEILKRLSFCVKKHLDDELSVTVPTFRNDISAEIDLIEEVARIYGYNHIPKSSPRVHLSTIPHSPLFLFERKIRTELLKSGLTEFLTCDLISPKMASLAIEKDLDETHLLRVLHPSSLDQSILRTSLLPGHLQAIQLNFDHQTSNIAAFEVGRIHFRVDGKIEEPHVLALSLTGMKKPFHFQDPSCSVDFFDLKGHLENLFTSLNLEKVSFRPSRLDSFHPNIQAEVYIHNTLVAVAGQVHPKHTEIKTPIYFAQVELEELLRLQSGVKQMTPLPLYPGTSRDWTLTLKKELPLSALYDAIKTCQSPLLTNYELIGIYEGEKLSKNEKNVTLRFYYRKENETIKSETVEKLQNKLQSKVTALLEI
ncbi:MAG: phenylalanine--tRNA ligase subunit beta [Simkaniaceae bacterium]